MPSPRFSTAVRRVQRPVLGARRNGLTSRRHRTAPFRPPGWRRGASLRPQSRAMPPGAAARPGRIATAHRRALRQKRASRLPAFRRLKAWRQAAHGPALGTGHGVRPAGFAPVGSGSTARRRRTRLLFMPIRRGDDFWRARMPEAVKPFLALQETALRCPTCKAWQLPSLQCRRCKCDLSLVVAMHDQQRQLHARVLRLIASGRNLEALSAARSRWALSPDPQAARLLAICCLLLGQFGTAQELCDRAR